MNINIEVLLRFVVWIALGMAIATLFGLPVWTGGLFMVFFVPLAVTYFHLAAAEDLQTTFIKTGEIKFVVRGEEVERVLENIEGWHYNDQTGEIVEDSPSYNRKKPFLARWLGIYWVSLIYPAKKIHEYKFEWEKLHPKGHPPRNISEKITYFGGEGGYPLEHRDEPVKSIYFRYPYPVRSDEVELRDNFNVDILTNITFQVVFPKTPVFLLKGNWLAPAIAAVQGAIADFANNHILEEFRDFDKQIPGETGAGNGFADAIMKINGEELSAGKYTDGIIKSFGVKVHKVDFIMYDLSPSYAEVKKASTAESVAIHNARAKRADAQGEADAIRSVEQAKADMLRARLDAANTHPLGGEVLIEQFRKEGLEGFQGSVLSLGGDRTGIMVNADTSRQKRKSGDDPAKAGASPAQEPASTT